MKKLALSLTIIAAGLSMFAADASAQRIVVETPGVRLVPGSGRGDRRAGYELDRLNREIQQVRFELRTFRGGVPRVRARFDRVLRAADRLNYEYNRRVVPPYETRRRIEQVRAELYAIREDLRSRGDRRDRWDDDRPRGWR
ncbi:MAG: hypothetical protein AVDCRST_MAG42-1791 [uncultured Chthoniobacterales bacterium]|uniref:Uncharacterized protein n=1 Tax=uncultured Chthoniobacterales bacterium TaxID=1836801 RepID=A0A6J4HZ63_9BACT|nr:MAG: hypothetical protein AVDCRST_MAG42-1791 [uncultured Chthoniobacterales bacterium]